MVVPELSLMNINHRYYSIETFFKAAGEAGYRNIELCDAPVCGLP